MTRTLFAGAAICALIAGAATSASADDLSYTYLEIMGTLENPDRDFAFIGPADETAQTASGDGYGGSAKVSISLPEFFPFIGFHVVGEYTQTSIDYTTLFNTIGEQGDVAPLLFSEDQNEWRLAAGAHVNLADRVSAYAELGLSGVDIGDLSGLPSTGKTGLDARIGLRALISEKFELNGFARANPNGGFDLQTIGNLGQSDFENAATFGVGARYKITGGFSAVADYEFGDAVSRLRAGIRFSF